MKTWDAFHPYILIDVPGAAVPLVNQKLCLAAREFCERTSAWEEFSDPVAVVEGVEYDIDIPTGAELVRIVSAAGADGEEIDVVVNDATPRSTKGRGTRFVLTQTEDGTAFKVNAALSGKTITVLMAFKPLLTATSVGDVLAVKYADAIAAKAKAMLQLVPNQPFSDPGSASVNASLFEAMVHQVANRSFAARTHKRVSRMDIE